MAIANRPTKPKLEEIRAYLDGEESPAQQAQPAAQPAVQAPSHTILHTPKPAAKPIVSVQTEPGDKAVKGTNKRANKEIITVGFDHTFIPHLSAAAEMLRINRTAFINLACAALVRKTYQDYVDGVDSGKR